MADGVYELEVLLSKQQNQVMLGCRKAIVVAQQLCCMRLQALGPQHSAMFGERDVGFGCDVPKW